MLASSISASDRFRQGVLNALAGLFIMEDDLTNTREENAADLAYEEQERANWPTRYVRIIQSYNVTRTITVAIKAPDDEQAIEWVASEEAPNSQDPRWENRWGLENEEYEIVK
jgi:ribulose bisphosphate carboxylase small subunit